MDRWHWLWLLGFLNSLSFFLVGWRYIALRMRVDDLARLVRLLKGRCEDDHLAFLLHCEVAHDPRDIDKLRDRYQAAIRKGA